MLQLNSKFIKARMNPSMFVFVLFTGQVGFRNATPLPIFNALDEYPNIRFYRIDISSYFEDTPLRYLIKNKTLIYSKHYQKHVTDALRYVRFVQ